MTETMHQAQLDQGFQRLYQKLKAIARAQRGKIAQDTLNTTALVHELYLRLAQHPDFTLQRDIQFYSYAAQAMRHMLLDRARARQRLKAGGDQVRLNLDDADLPAVGDLAHRVLEMDEALNQLQAMDPRAAEVVSLHFFAGLEFEQIAELKGLNRRTIHRDWRFARAFLTHALEA